MGVSITPQLRWEIQHSEESVRALARRYNISPATVQKWRKRADTSELRRGPKPGHSTAVPRYVEEAFVLFREQTLLPLDDCLYALRIGNPGLSRATLHRYFRKRGLSALGRIDGYSAVPKGVQIGYVHIGFMRIRVRNGEAYMLSGFDRVSKYTFSAARPHLSPAVFADFLEGLCQTAPFAIHTVQTNSHDHFTEPSKTFAQACGRLGVAHRISPWIGTERSAEQSDAAGEGDEEGFFFESVDEVAAILSRQVHDYNLSCKLKSLGGLTPAEFVAKQ